MLKKAGVQLLDILPAGEEEWVRRLRDEFSITTAEELFCASLKRQDALQKHLELSDDKWAALTRAIEAALPLATRQKLEAPASGSYFKGVKLQPPPVGMLTDLKKYTSRD